MKKFMCLILVMTFCACFALPAFATEGDDGYVPSPSVPPVECDHASTTVVGEKNATCTSKGYSGDHVCDNCGEVVTQGESIAMVDHDYVDGVCADCGAEEPDSNGFKLVWVIVPVVTLAGVAVAGFFVLRRRIW